MKKYKIATVRGILEALDTPIGTGELQDADNIQHLRDLISDTRREAEAHYFICLHCKKACHDNYMLKHELGRGELGLANDAGVLHLRCVEELLGRDMYITDLMDAPVNEQLKLLWERGEKFGESRL